MRNFLFSGMKLPRGRLIFGIVPGEEGRRCPSCGQRNRASAWRRCDGSSSHVPVSFGRFASARVVAHGARSMWRHAWSDRWRHAASKEADNVCPCPRCRSPHTTTRGGEAPYVRRARHESNTPSCVPRHVALCWFHVAHTLQPPHLRDRT